MKNRKRSKKERILDEFAAYIKNNPGASYAEAAKAMNRVPMTIRRWCKELGIKLPMPPAGDQSTLTLGSTGGEEGIPSKVNEITDKANRRLKYLQEQILLKDGQIAELQNQIASDQDVFGRQEKELYKAKLEKQRELFAQMQQDYDTVLQEVRETREDKAAADETVKSVREQTSLAAQRFNWEITSMNKVAEVQRNLAAAEAKTQSPPQSPLDDLSKMVPIMDAIEKRVASRMPPPSPGGISYQAKNAEEYEKMLDIEYKHSGRQARDEMLKSVLIPLRDYLFLRLGFGSQSQGAQQISPQQTMSQQQPMPTQPRQPIQPTQESSYESPKPQAPQPQQPQMVYVFRSPDQYNVTCPQCDTPVAVALDSISVSRCGRCGTLVLVVEDIPENAEYIRQMKSNQWTEELTGKIKLATQRFNEVTMTGLGLETQPLINDQRRGP